MIQLLSFIALLLPTLHPFHVSVCSIHHAADEQTLQITQKIFADDLEEALNNQAADKTATIDVLQPSDPQALERVIADYLDSHLQISVNGQALKLRFLGYEREDLALWCYLETEDVPDIQSLTVRSTILTDAFDDQTNIVHIEYQDAVKSMKLAKSYPENQVIF